jgi:glycerophosphoryl diester phosphodiesterase
MGPVDVFKLRVRSLGIPTGRFASGCVQVPVKKGVIPVVDARSVRTAHRLGQQVHVWTIDDPQEMNRLLDLGVDGIITDRPAILKAVLQQREEWA